MSRYAYTYLKLDLNKVEEYLDVYAKAGWRVHTFNRNPSASVVDILLEREVDS